MGVTLGFDPKRVYSALVLLPLLYVLTRHLPPVAFFVLITTTVLFAQWELLGLFFERRDLPRHALVVFPGALLLLIAMQWPAALGFSLALSITLVGLLCYQIGFAPSGNGHPAMFIFLFGILYVGYTFGHFLWLRNQHDGALLVLFVLLVTWAGDAAAYYVGKTWGVWPLAPRLSPKKTIEGFLGGLIAAPLIAWIGHLWFLPAVTPVDCLILGLLFTVLGLLGDLSESALKRSAGVKDSGSLIPGHGGMLDRIDSLLLNGPFFYYYMAFVR
ncbi:MAG: phosphatidate cytidylyltransferase [Nitrospira sp.]|nr:phosphatidate cytidylyltransferase [Nitrospira sp.]